MLSWKLPIIIVFFGIVKPHLLAGFSRTLFGADDLADFFGVAGDLINKI
jgi:hypothetical protein